VPPVGMQNGRPEVVCPSMLLQSRAAVMSTSCNALVGEFLQRRDTR
jgi:hypothetical protein